jgi:ribosomal protein S18 acetylase RimI-like enzyme
MLWDMEIRPATAPDYDWIRGIDGTIESTHYLHVHASGQGLAAGWRMEERPLRSKLIQTNPLDDESGFLLKQVVTGIDEGMALVCEHQGQVVAAVLAQLQPQSRILRIVDLRVDVDFRRQGLATALLYRCVQEAREKDLRAVAARSLTNNSPACHLLARTGFELAGLDCRLSSNHDLVKEAVTLFWYTSLD